MNKNWATRLKEAIEESSQNQFGNTMVSTEYITEAEHQDGIEYWNQFGSESEAIQDFVDYCEAAGYYDER